jgi:hypothetical protein
MSQTATHERSIDKSGSSRLSEPLLTAPILCKPPSQKNIRILSFHVLTLVCAKVLIMERFNRQEIRQSADQAHACSLVKQGALDPVLVATQREFHNHFTTRPPIPLSASTFEMLSRHR